MKKILLLGGSFQQIVAIETAKKMGYYTILCDYLEDNPGQNYCDKFYLISTTDKEKILDVALKEKIDGVLAYASDPAAPTAAYVAEKMGLPGNPYKSVETLCKKDKFRKFLADNGFCVPKAKSYSDLDEAVNDLKKKKYDMPVLVKPVDSSGSKGVSLIENEKDLYGKLSNAMHFSLSKRIIIEEFIEKKHPYLIGGDIFVQDGKIIQWGLMNCHRDYKANPFVPVGKSFPPAIDNEDLGKIKDTLQSLINRLGIKFGPMNVEVIADKNDNVYLVDIGPRNGGNMIPDLLGDIFDCNIVEMTIRCAMGKEICYPMSDGKPYYATYNLHSCDEGILEKIEFSNNAESKIYRKRIYVNKEDPVHFFEHSAFALGIVFLHFDNNEEMLNYMDNGDKWNKIILKKMKHRTTDKD